MRWLLLLNLLLLIPFSAAVVIDEANILTPQLLQQIDDFNARSAVKLSVITTERSYDVKQQALENFNTYQLQLLVFYSKAQDQAVIVQPVTEGIPQEQLQEALSAYPPPHGQKLQDMIVAVFSLAGSWQPFTHGPLPICLLLKDGKCDKNCQGTDLDCLCGNNICEQFETVDICPADCHPGKDFWCGIRSDGYCDEDCAVWDRDCPVQPETRRSPTTLVLVLLGMMGIALIGVFLVKGKRR